MNLLKRHPPSWWPPLRQKLLAAPIRFKISIPYLVMATLLAALITYQVGQSFVGTLEARLRSQLVDIISRASEALVEVENTHLTLARAILFTNGLGEAVAAEDVAGVRALVYPLAVNNQAALVEVLDAHGARVLSLHASLIPGELLEQTRPAPYNTWPLVQTILDGQRDEMGRLFTMIVIAPWGEVLYTAGPIEQAGQLTGVLLVGTPLTKVAESLGRASFADVTLYKPTGEAGMSTLGEPNALALDEEIRQALETASEYIPTRYLISNNRAYIEALEPIRLRGKSTGWVMGVALPESIITAAKRPAFWRLMLIFILGFAGLVGLGAFIAQLISRPVSELVSATEEVGEGNLNIKLPVHSKDELGLLTEGFNNMIVGLKQRDLLRDLFGRMVSEEVREAVLNGKLRMGGDVYNVAILFTDLQDFTSLSEKNRPSEILDILNDFFKIVTRSTKKYGGLINHFSGDSALVIFGAPMARPLEESVGSAILTAKEIWREMVLANAARVSNGQGPIRFGIGVNSGPVVAGNLGTEDRFEYTVIGDAVNVAARLESLSRQFPRSPLIIASHCAQIVQDLGTHEFIELGEFPLKGKAEPLPVSAIVALEHPEFAWDEAFNRSPFPKDMISMALNLYCLGHEPQVIAKAVDATLEEVGGWLLEAVAFEEVLSQMLIVEYALTPKQLQRFDNLIEASEQWRLKNAPVR